MKKILSILATFYIAECYPSVLQDTTLSYMFDNNIIKSLEYLPKYTCDTIKEENTLYIDSFIIKEQKIAVVRDNSGNILSTNTQEPKIDVYMDSFNFYFQFYFKEDTNKYYFFPVGNMFSSNSIQIIYDTHIKEINGSNGTYYDFQYLYYPNGNIRCYVDWILDLNFGIYNKELLLFNNNGTVKEHIFNVNNALEYMKVLNDTLGNNNFPIHINRKGHGYYFTKKIIPEFYPFRHISTVKVKKFNIVSISSRINFFDPVYNSKYSYTKKNYGEFLEDSLSYSPIIYILKAKRNFYKITKYDEFTMQKTKMKLPKTDYDNNLPDWVKKSMMYQPVICR